MNIFRYLFGFVFNPVLLIRTINIAGANAETCGNPVVPCLHEERLPLTIVSYKISFALRALISIWIWSVMLVKCPFEMCMPIIYLAALLYLRNTVLKGFSKPDQPILKPNLFDISWIPNRCFLLWFSNHAALGILIYKSEDLAHNPSYNFSVFQFTW